MKGRRTLNLVLLGALVSGASILFVACLEGRTRSSQPLAVLKPSEQGSAQTGSKPTTVNKDDTGVNMRADDQGAKESAQEHDVLRLNVVLENLRNDKGRVSIALFDSASEFPDSERALKRWSGKPHRRQVTVTFSGLKPGRYALAGHHDENADGEMNYGFMGMPKEGFAFSNNAPVTLGPPSFEAAAIEIRNATTVHTATVRYF